MHYKLYSTEDFIQDEFFQHWIFAPNEENNQYWKTFLLHYPAQQSKVEEAREFLLAMRFEREVPESVVQRIKFNFNTAIDQFEAAQLQARHTAKEKPRRAPGRSVFFRIVYPVAASLLLAAICAAYFMVQRNSTFSVLQTLTLNQEKTPKGVQRHITLDDGTQVWLNANSVLKYPKDFSEKKNREVFLDGEAFFDVSENKEKPFIVRTSDLAIKVLGTAFNVRSYANDPVVETTLVRGKVSIASPAEDSLHHVTLLPNQQALFSKDSKKIALEETVNTEDYTAWKNGLMVFDNKPFSYIKETLERWYDVSITMEDEKSLSCTFSAKFKDKTLQEVLDIFKNTESINYWIDGDQVFINGRLCQYENPN